MLKIFWLFVPLMHLCTTTFHSVHNFHPPAEISAATHTHSQIGLKENGCQTSPVSCPSHSTDKLPCYHMKRMPSYAYLYQLPCTDHHGRFWYTRMSAKAFVEIYLMGDIPVQIKLDLRGNALARAKPLNTRVELSFHF